MNYWNLSFKNHFNLHFLTPLSFDYTCKLSILQKGPVSSVKILRISNVWSVWTGYVSIWWQILEWNDKLQINKQRKQTNTYIKHCSVINSVSRKIKHRYRDTIYITTSFLKRKSLNILLENFCEFVNKTKHIINFYRCVKHFSDAISIFYMFD